MFDMEKKEKSKVRDPLTFSKEMEDALLEDFAPSGVESPGITEQYFVALVRAFSGASSSWPDLIHKVDEAYKREMDDFMKTGLAVIRAKAEIILAKEQESER